MLIECGLGLIRLFQRVLLLFRGFILYFIISENFNIKNLKPIDYLFVAGHYQVMDSRGDYDKALVHNLLPKMKKYNVQGYFQGHRHTMEHNQGRGTNLHYFTIGAGALIEHGSVKNHLLERPETNNACVMNNPSNHQSYCYFYWFTKEMRHFV